MIRLSELEQLGKDRDRVLVFLRELERRGMIWSRLEQKINGEGMERIWYGYQSKDAEVKEDI